MSAPVIDSLDPYTPYLISLNSFFYPEPTPNFKIRLGILFGLNGSAILLGLTYILILSLEAKRRGTVKRMWLFRLVQRPSGRYIASNQHMWSALMTIISSTVLICHVADCFNVYVNKGSQVAASFLRSFSFLPLFVHGWIISCSILQSFLLTPDQHDKPFLTALIANSLFIGGGALLFVGMFVTATLATVEGSILWNKASYLMGSLSFLGKEWNSGPAGMKAATPSLEMLQSFGALFTSLQESGVSYTTALYNQCAFLCVVPLLTACVNLTSIALARVLRRQISRNFLYIRQHSLRYGEESGSSESNSSKTVGSIPESRRPSRSCVRAMAKDEENGLESEQAKKIVVLQKAERDLWLISNFSLLVLMSAAVLVIWIAVNLKHDGGAEILVWPLAELALFGTEWIYVVSANITLLFLIYNSYTYIEPQSQFNSMIEVRRNQSVSSTSKVSWKEMFAGGIDEMVILPEANRQISPLEVVVETETEIDFDEGKESEYESECVYSNKTKSRRDFASIG